MRYEIRVENGIDRHWSSWFDGMRITPEPDGVTLIEGRVTDQAALHGVLTRVCNLGLILVSVRRIEPEEDE